MIEKLITQSRVTEVNDAATQLLGAHQNAELTDPYLDSTFTDLDARNTELTQSINRSKAESDMETYDEGRDERIRALYYLLLGFSHHPVSEIKEAAQLLLNVFENYGLAITKESYATESSLVNSLLHDLAKPEYQQAITALSGCAGLIAGLQEAQAIFEHARIVYETEKAREGMVNNATELKKVVLEIINTKIVVYLRAMEQVNPATYSVFANTCAQIIADINEQVKKRQQKKEPAMEA